MSKIRQILSIIYRNPRLGCLSVFVLAFLIVPGCSPLIGQLRARGVDHLCEHIHDGARFNETLFRRIARDEGIDPGLVHGTDGSTRGIIHESTWLWYSRVCRFDVHDGVISDFSLFTYEPP